MSYIWSYDNIHSLESRSVCLWLTDYQIGQLTSKSISSHSYVLPCICCVPMGIFSNLAANGLRALSLSGSERKLSHIIKRKLDFCIYAKTKLY